jgi:hypothetical protein
MKRIAVTWEETAVYEAVIEVPDDYPESVEAYDDVEALLSGQSARATGGIGSRRRSRTGRRRT